MSVAYTKQGEPPPQPKEQVMEAKKEALQFLIGQRAWQSLLV